MSGNASWPRVQVGQCTPSIRCAGRGFQQAAAGVVDIYAMDVRIGAMGICTGPPPRPCGHTYVTYMLAALFVN